MLMIISLEQSAVRKKGHDEYASTSIPKTLGSVDDRYDRQSLKLRATHLTSVSTTPPRKELLRQGCIEGRDFA